MTDHRTTNDDRMASRLLQHASTDLTPDVERLVSHGVSRGRSLRRRRRVGTSLAAAAVIGVIGVAASVGPGLLRDDSSAPGFAEQTTPTPSPPTTPAAFEVRPSLTKIDADIAVAAEEIPSVVADLLGSGELGEIRQDATFPLVDEVQSKTVHFLWERTLTTVVIERADSLASCTAMVDPANQANGQPGGECVFVDGLETLTVEPETYDQVTSQGVSAWQHGYIVSVLSYNANEGKDVVPVTEVPPISLDELMMLASSEVWFD
ncbi:MAG: hypothetical protein WB767_14255 [Nocardioides sp.]